VILSGPEPQGKSLTELVAILKDKEPHTIMFEGKPGKSGTQIAMAILLLLSSACSHYERDY